MRRRVWDWGWRMVCDNKMMIVILNPCVSGKEILVCWGSTKVEPSRLYASRWRHHLATSIMNFLDIS
jgi:hypothetical protein